MLNRKNFVTNFFKVGEGIFYANEIWRHELAISFDFKAI